MNKNLQELHGKLQKNGYYVFGAGNIGTQIAATLKTQYTFHGFIDNTRTKKDHVYSLDSISSKQALIILGAVAHEYEIAQQCLDQGFQNILFFGQACVLFPDFQDMVMPYKRLQENYKENVARFNQLYEFFVDVHSQKVLDALILYRKNLQWDLFAQINTSRTHKQYFEPFLPMDIEVFVDGGGFDGETSKEFLHNYPKTRCIYYFEPDTHNFKISQKALDHIQCISLFEKGIADREKVLSFNALNNSSASFCPTGNILVPCVALDDVVLEERAYIKLDVEGAELEAIAGAKRLLQNGSPFAICVYHRASDLYEIPHAILQINPRYQLYLRHYTNAIFETVLYGICP